MIKFILVLLSCFVLILCSNFNTLKFVVGVVRVVGDLRLNRRVTPIEEYLFKEGGSERGRERGRKGGRERGRKGGREEGREGEREGQ